MIDKKNSDDEFSDEGFDEEFSFEEDEAHPEVKTAPSKGRSFSFASPIIKKVAVNLLLTAVLIVSVYSVYQYWVAVKSKGNLASKTQKTTVSTASTAKTQTVPTKASSTKETTTSDKAVDPQHKAEAAGAFSESDMASVLREETKTTTQSSSQNTPDAQKGVFVFKNVTPPGTTTTAGTSTGTPTTAAAPATSVGSTSTTLNAEPASPQTPAQAQTAAGGEHPDSNLVSKTDTTVEDIKALEAKLEKKAAETKAAEAAKTAETIHHADHKADTGVASMVVSPATHLEKALATPAITATPTIVAGHPNPTSASTPPPSSTVNTAEVKEMTQQINKTLDSLSKLNNQMEGNLNQVKYLDAYTREVSLNIEKLNAQASTMDNRIQALTNLANSLSKDLGKVRNEVGYAKRVAGDRVAGEENLDLLNPPARRKDVMVMDEGGDCSGGYAAPKQRMARPCSTGPEEPEYVVHAVIPGRAWLKSCKGQIITVIEGEAVGNYGKVLVIDAGNSVVLTSSGVAFR